MASPTTADKRSDATRERLLDAVEAIVANGGYGAPSHRSIGQRAGVHTALVNYHFGTKEMLYESMIGRRAGELTARWQKAITAAREHDPVTAEHVLAAYWAPFGAEDAFGSNPWRNYLCSVAWLSQAGDGAAGWERHFDPVEREFRQALAESLPHLNAEEIRRGFRYARELLDSVLLHRCEKTDGTLRRVGARGPARPGHRHADRLPRRGPARAPLRADDRAQGDRGSARERDPPTRKRQGRRTRRDSARRGRGRAPRPRPTVSRRM